MDIERDKEYVITPCGPYSTKYFEDKYGTPNPMIRVEDVDTVIWPNGGWGMQDGNIACMLFAMRVGMDGMRIATEGGVWYGKIGGLGELVLKSELL